MVLWKGLRVISVGMLIGVLASLGFTRFLAGQILGVSVTDPWTFCLVVTVFLAAGLIASLICFRRKLCAVMETGPRSWPATKSNKVLDTNLFAGTVCTMTSRTTFGARVRPPLTDLENEVMQAIWNLGKCSVEAVHRIVSRKRNLKETTTRTLMRRLEQKGYLKHESDGRAYIYRAAEPARSLAARAVRQIIDRFCQGSVEELVNGMVEAKVLNKDDIDQLEKFVRNRRPGGK